MLVLKRRRWMAKAAMSSSSHSASTLVQAGPDVLALSLEGVDALFGDLGLAIDPTFGVGDAPQ